MQVHTMTLHALLLLQSTQGTTACSTSEAMKDVSVVTTAALSVIEKTHRAMIIALMAYVSAVSSSETCTK
jgi:hypothetical protein